MLIAAFVLLFGGLMLAIRSSDSLFGTLLQRENIDARDAAEAGMTRIVAELNRPVNRGLLVKAGAVADGEGSYLWSSADATRNPCLSRSGDPASDLTTNAGLGFQAGGTYREVLLDANGHVVTVRSQAVRAYRLIAVRRQPLLLADGRPSLRIFEADGRGTVSLVVEGSALRNGTTISRVRLAQDLQLVPKCCNSSFGGQHGNTNYAPDSQGRSVCITTGWGFVAGVAQNNTGSLTINGVTTITDDAGTIVDPLTCIADSVDQCQFKPTSTSYTLQLADPFPRPVRTNPLILAGVMGSITRDTPPQAYASVSAPQPFLHCTVPGVTPASLRQCPGGKVTINANAADAYLPVNEASVRYCEPGNYSDHPESVPALHCNIRLLDYSQLVVEVVNTSARPLRLYFPEAGDVVHSTGVGSLSHLGEATHFSLFGCASCGSQGIKLAGSAAGLELFAWFPRGVITVSGGASYGGVIWANTITSSGGVTWTIPSSGVLSALELAGFGLSDGLNPPRFDWVARSVRSFSWSGL